MAGIPPLKNSAYTFDVCLVSQADTDVFKTSVTLAAGDIQVSKDGGTFANITTLPTEIGTTGVLPIALTATEMNADRVTVRFHDAAGDEWQDLLVTIDTETVQINDLATASALQTVDGVVDAIKLKTDLLPADPADSSDIPSAATITDAVWDEILEGTLSIKEVIRILLSVMAGKSIGGGTTTVKFRDVLDTKDRIIAIIDTNGNRNSVIVDGS